MKKRALFLVMLLCLSLCACGRLANIEVRDYNALCIRADETGEGSLGAMLPYLARSYREDMIYSSRVNHPIMAFTDAGAFASFREELGAYFQFDVSYDGEASFLAQTAEFDEAFFADTALIVVHLMASSGSIRYELDYLDNKGGDCTVFIRELVPEIGTDDEADWFLLLQIPKAELTEVKGFTAYISESVPVK